MAGQSIDITKEMRKRERKLKRQQRIAKIKEFWNDNKEIIIAVVPAACGLIGMGIRVIGKHHNLRLEERNKDLRCYDTSLGHYWELRRKLGNSEWVEIERRRKSGERLADILDDMNVLR